MMRQYRIFFILLVAIPNHLYAQLPAIGNWREHLPYHQAIRVFNAAGKIICSTPFSFFTIDKKERSLDRISKLTGLTETGIAASQYDSVLDKMIIAYTSSNIDILSSAQVANIPDFKLKNIVGDKTIYQICTNDGLAYLATGIGILVVDENRNEIRDTYLVGDNGGAIKVNSITTAQGNLYAATGTGLKAVALNSADPADYHNWQLLSGNNGLPASPADEVDAFQASVIARIGDSLFMANGNAWSFFYADGWSIKNTHISGNTILLCEQKNGAGRVVVLNQLAAIVKTIQDPVRVVIPSDALLIDNDYWVADSLFGLSLFNDGSPESFVPNSPQSLATGDMIYSNTSLWVAAGGLDSNGNRQHNPNGLYRLSGNEWTNYNGYGYPELDTVRDCIVLAGNPGDSSVWAGSFGDGLLQVLPGPGFRFYKKNSPIAPIPSNPDDYRVSGLDFDMNHNLWIANDGAANPLVVRKADGSWVSFAVPLPVTNNRIAQILVDDGNQLWIIAAPADGLICYNPGKSVDATSDDQWKAYHQGSGNGNLPDNHVLCLAKDKNGFIWVGTINGIGIIQCSNDVFDSRGCEAVLPVVQFDNFAGYLFYNEQVQTITVDGANRKWVGTKNGVWLISADAQKIIHHFTEDNSPLLSNDVKKIKADPVTGEVFFATAKGICSFRGEATEGGETNSGVLVFPNPVPPGYNGSIGIKGLVNNAIVKITDLDGRLVYQTVALGGQAVWNGRDYKGRSISTGVYLVLVSDENRQEKLVTKIAFIGK